MIYWVLGLERNRLASPFREQRSWLLPVLALYVLACGALCWGVSQAVPEAYMDEEFHLDQFTHYLDGNFSYWNPKLTTPPALYLLNLPLVRQLSKLGLPILTICRLANSILFNGLCLFFLH
jgi:hypothetical protein